MKSEWEDERQHGDDVMAPAAHPLPVPFPFSRQQAAVRMTAMNSEEEKDKVRSFEHIETEEELFQRTGIHEYLVADLQKDAAPGNSSAEMEREIVEWLAANSPRFRAWFDPTNPPNPPPDRFEVDTALEKIRTLRRKVRETVLEFRLNQELLKTVRASSLTLTDKHRRTSFLRGENVAQAYQALLKHLGYSPLDALPLDAKPESLMIAPVKVLAISSSPIQPHLQVGGGDGNDDGTGGRTSEDLTPFLGGLPDSGDLNDRARPTFREGYGWSPIIVTTNYDVIREQLQPADRSQLLVYHGHHLPSSDKLLRFHQGNASLERWTVRQIPLTWPGLRIEIRYVLPSLLEAHDPATLSAHQAAPPELGTPLTVPLTRFLASQSSKRKVLSGVSCSAALSDIRGVPPTPPHLYSLRVPQYVEQEQAFHSQRPRAKGPRKNARREEHIERHSARLFYVVQENRLDDLSEWNEVRVGPMYSVQPLRELLQQHPVWSIRAGTCDGKPISELSDRDLVDHGQRVRVRVTFADTPAFRQFLEQRRLDVKDKRYQRRPLVVETLSDDELSAEALRLVSLWSQETPPPGDKEMAFRVPSPLRTFVILALHRRGSSIFTEEYLRRFRHLLYTRGPVLSIFQHRELLDAWFWVYLSSLQEREDMWNHLRERSAYSGSLQELTTTFQELLDFYLSIGVTGRLINPYNITGLSSGRTSVSGDLRHFSVPNKRLYYSPHIEIDPTGQAVARLTGLASSSSSSSSPLSSLHPGRHSSRQTSGTETAAENLLPVNLIRKSERTVLPVPAPMHKGTGRGRRPHQKPIDPSTLSLSNFFHVINVTPATALSSSQTHPLPATTIPTTSSSSSSHSSCSPSNVSLSHSTAVIPPSPENSQSSSSFSSSSSSSSSSSATEDGRGRDAARDDDDAPRKKAATQQPTTASKMHIKSEIPLVLFSPTELPIIFPPPEPRRSQTRKLPASSSSSSSLGLLIASPKTLNSISAPEIGSFDANHPDHPTQFEEESEEILDQGHASLDGDDRFIDIDDEEISNYILGHYERNFRALVEDSRGRVSDAAFADLWHFEADDTPTRRPNKRTKRQRQPAAS